MRRVKPLSPAAAMQTRNVMVAESVVRLSAFTRRVADGDPARSPLVAVRAAVRSLPGPEHGDHMPVSTWARRRLSTAKTAGTSYFRLGRNRKESALDIGSWLGNAVVGQFLALHTHLLIMHTLTALGFPRDTWHAHCAFRASRPTNTGATHFARAIKLTCWISQKVTGGS